MQQAIIKIFIKRAMRYAIKILFVVSSHVMIEMFIIASPIISLLHPSIIEVTLSFVDDLYYQEIQTFRQIIDTA
jgi:hypothetical protein